MTPQTPPATDLRQRLARLKGLPTPPGARSPGLADLLARIERMRCRARPATVPTMRRPLAERLGGENLAPGLVRVERRHPLWQPCGRRRLGEWLADAGALSPLPLADLLLVDCETSGLAGGTGTVAWMVGFAHLGAEAVTTRQYVIDRFAAEPALLDAVAAEMRGAAALVSFNGKSYDLPLLATRFRLQGRELPAPAGHLDLLHPLRRRWKKRLPDCRLSTLEAAVLGLPRHDDVPGAAGPAIWKGLLEGKSDAQLEGMARHNRLDLLGMGALLGEAVNGMGSDSPWLDPTLMTSRNESQALSKP